MVGPSPRQRDALLRHLLTSQRKAQLSRPRHRARRLPMHLFRRDPARQQNRIHRLSRLIHHPHNDVLRARHRTASIHRTEECSQRAVLDGFGGLCYQWHRPAADCVFQHHVLLP